jgi:hypothetical protein
MKSGLYLPENILNFDETSFPKEIIGKKTITQIGEKHVKVITGGKDRLNYTIGITSSLTGKLLNTVIIWPSKGLRNKIKVKLNNVIV